MTRISIMTSSKPPPRFTIPGVHRLPIRVVGTGNKELSVDCPRRGAEVHVDRCTLCPACTGLSLRDHYLVCAPPVETHENEGNEPPQQDDALRAPEAQALHRPDCRFAWFGAELPLLESCAEGIVGDANHGRPGIFRR